MKNGGLVQAESDVQDNETPFVCSLEDAVPIAEAAVVVREGKDPAVPPAPGFAIMEYFFYLNAIGADILHGGGAYTAGDEGKVFYAGPVAAEAVLHEAVPGFAGAGTDIYMGLVFR